MKRKVVLKIIAVLLVMIFLIGSTSFATSIDLATLKSSLETVFYQKMTIKGSNNSEQSTSLSTHEPMNDVKINDSKIELKNEDMDLGYINYYLEGNVCTYDMNIDNLYELYKKQMGKDIEKWTKEDKDTYNMLVTFFAYEFMGECYIATAHAVEGDLSLLYTYFQQQIENNAQTTNSKISNDCFSLTRSYDKNGLINQFLLTINIGNLLNPEKIKIDNSKSVYKVFFGELPEAEKLSIKEREEFLDEITNKTYTGSAIKPKLSLLGLEEGTDYKIEYKNNTNTGNAKIVITGIGNYKDVITKLFKIIPTQVKDLKVKSQAKKQITLKWTKNGGNVTGYKVYLYDYKKKKWNYVGKTKDNKYTVKNLNVGTTYKFKVRAYKNIDGKQYFGKYSKTIRTATKTKNPSILRISTNKKKVTLQWSKVSGASGFEVYMATSKNGNYEKIKTIKKATTLKYTKSNLKKNKKYYFKVRAFRTVDGSKIFSSYSDVKNIKVQ